MSERPQIVVVGGGITGLSAAYRLLELNQQADRLADITLLEATSRHGGLFGSEKIGDYLIERGADSFITNKPAAVNLCHRLGLADELIPTDDRYRRSLILHQGRPVATPEGFNLLAPGQWWPMVTTPLLSWVGKLRVAAELFIAKGPANSDESLASFVRRRFGQEVLDNIVQPLVGGIYTSDPEKLSLKATLPRFIDLEQRYGSVIRGLRAQEAQSRGQEAASGARYGLFATLRHGMGQLLDTLRTKLESGIGVRTGVRLDRITPVQNGTGYRLQLSTSEVLEADAVVLALPAHGVAQLVQPWAADLAQELKGIEYASSAIAVSGHRLSDISHPVEAFGLVIPHKERRRILAVSFLSRKFPGRAPEGRIILRTFVGGAMQPEEYGYSDAEIEQTVLSELKSTLGVTGKPEFVVLARYPNSMPQFHVGHVDRVKRIEQLAANLPRLALAGNAYYGVGVPDSIASAEQAAVRLWKSIFSGAEMDAPVA